MLTLINGNKQAYTIDLPRIVILTDYFNDEALAHVKENTGLEFVRDSWNYNAQPTDPEQIVKLLMTYNFKTRYFNNWDHHNTLMLKFDHHVGFDVDSICYECVKHNNISTNGLTEDDRLAC